jgi:hypothetical protein
MKCSLAIAIPTMDRWDFLKRQLPVYLEHPSVDCVIICDENGHDIDEICAAGLDTNPKLRLYQNETVLGVYGNKRQCLMKAPTDYVAVLDSDNFFDAAYITTVVDCIKRDLYENNNTTIYCAAGNERLFLETGKVENKIKHFSGMLINRSNWNNILKIPWSLFLLNDGNFVVHKSLLNILPDDVNDNLIVATDAIYVARKAVGAGFTYWVVPELSYIHTVHDESYWLRTATESSRILMGKDWRI